MALMVFIWYLDDIEILKVLSSQLQHKREDPLAGSSRRLFNHINTDAIPHVRREKITTTEVIGSSI